MNSRLLASTLELALALTLGGCATATAAPQLADTAAAVQAATTTEKDAYRKTVTISGPEVAFVPSYRGGWFLRSWQVQGEVDECQLYVVYRDTTWAFLNEAHDKSGASFDVTEIDHQVRRGVTEVIGVSLSRAYLDAHRQTGLDIRIDGKRGRVTVQVPAYYVQGFLAALPSETPAS